MAETMNGLKRTSYCGKLSKANVGKEEVVWLGTETERQGSSGLYRPA